MWRRVRRAVMDSIGDHACCSAGAGSSSSHGGMSAAMACYSTVIPATLPCNAKFSAAEVAHYVVAGEEEKVCTMIRHCSSGAGAKVWQAISSPYCHSVHSYVPHHHRTPCVICDQGGLYVPLINLVCFYKLYRALTSMLNEIYQDAGYGAPSWGKACTSTDDVGFQSVHICVIVDFPPGLRALLSKMNKLDMQCFKNNSPLVLAILKRSGEALKELCHALDQPYLETVYRVCTPQSGYGTQFTNPMQLITRDSYTWPWVEGMEILLKHGANVDVLDDCERTPLFYAVEYGHRAMVELLTKYNADINFMDASGRTPLHCIFSNVDHPGSEKVEMLKTLLELGADQFLADHGNLLPIHKAIKLKSKTCNTKCLELLVRFCHPLDLFALAFDRLEIVAQWRYLHRLHDRLNLHDSMPAFFREQFEDGVSLWLWMSLWLIAGSGRMLTPMLDKHLYFDASVVENFRDNNKQLYAYLRCLIEENRTKPVSLMETCRFRIRLCLANVLEKTVQQLPLPKPLTRYLLMENVPTDWAELPHCHVIS